MSCNAKNPCPSCRRIMAEYGSTPPSPSMEAVEQSETVMAHRLWRWTASDGLIGPSGMPWRKSFMRAVCLSYDHIAPHGWESPASTSDFTGFKTGRSLINKWLYPCWCGVNAFKLTEPFELGDIAYTPGDLPVLGVVELGGIVDEYDRGYRAEYGQIQELTVLTGLPVDVSPLEEKYDVPVRTMSFEDWRKEWEITYGQDRAESGGDRKSDTEDSDTETGAPPFHSSTWTGTIPAGSTITTTGTRPPALTPLAYQRIMAAIRTVPPTRWQRFKHEIKWWWGSSWLDKVTLAYVAACLVLAVIGIFALIRSAVT